MTIDTIGVGIAVIAAVFYLGRMFYRSFRGETDCGCRHCPAGERLCTRPDGSLSKSARGSER